MKTLDSYEEVQKLLSDFVSAAGVNIARARHHAFWATMTYEDFITKDVPGVSPKFKILEVGKPEHSTIVQILEGKGMAADYFGQMPRPNPPYDSSAPSQEDVTAALSDWIKRGCPHGGS